MFSTLNILDVNASRHRVGVIGTMIAIIHPLSCVRGALIEPVDLAATFHSSDGVHSTNTLILRAAIWEQSDNRCTLCACEGQRILGLCPRIAQLTCSAGRKRPEASFSGSLKTNFLLLSRINRSHT